MFYVLGQDGFRNGVDGAPTVSRLFPAGAATIRKASPYSATAFLLTSEQIKNIEEDTQLKNQ